MSNQKEMGPRGSRVPGQYRGGEAPGRKGGSARLVGMHNPVPPGGGYQDILREHAREPAAFQTPAAKRAESAKRAQRPAGRDLDGAGRAPLCPAWCPVKYAMPMNAGEAHGPAKFGSVVLEGDRKKVPPLLLC